MAVVPLDHLRVRAADLRDAEERRPGVDEVGDDTVAERVGGAPQRPDAAAVGGVSGRTASVRDRSSATAIAADPDRDKGRFICISEPITTGEGAEVAESLELIAALSLIVGARDPCSRTITCGRTVTKEAPWLNALPKRLALRPQGIMLLDPAQVRVLSGVPKSASAFFNSFDRRPTMTGRARLACQASRLFLTRYRYIPSLLRIGSITRIRRCPPVAAMGGDR
ncbi:hypothetical protein WR25_16474 [Diploscapter pachys]|uniref:Uncharacterized protein n=1 Tax=Diploscapter pachys TaxID=2018661 RepID=A0A2A2KD59_9BILA|nr:hypothetical protein WR25_16474 [Diploscapter pachys]